jgi:hypothetical protein
LKDKHVGFGVADLPSVTVGIVSALWRESAAMRMLVKDLQPASPRSTDRDIAIFMLEHPLEQVAINGGILSDDQQRVEEHKAPTRDPTDLVRPGNV